MDGAPPDVISQIVAVLLSLGLPGVIIIALCFACYRLYNRNQELHDTMFEMGRDVAKSQEATASAIRELTNAMLRGRHEG